MKSARQTQQDGNKALEKKGGTPKLADDWWARRDSNPRPRDYESPALPLSYRPFNNEYNRFRRLMSIVGRKRTNRKVLRQIADRRHRGESWFIESTQCLVVMVGTVRTVSSLALI